MPAERKLLAQLNDDPAVGNTHRRYRFQLDPNGVTNVEWITAGVLDDKTGWKQVKACSLSAYSPAAVFTDHTYGYFDGQYRLSPTQPVDHLVDLGNLKETDCFFSSGLQKVCSGGDPYTKPMLGVLDAIKDSNEGSPLFRAWLFLKLNDLMRLQPDAWGLTFCPSARSDEAQIKKILGDPLNSGDWFLEAKGNAYGEKLERFFASIRSVSYAKQAAGLLALAQAVSKGGLAYAGFIGLDGKPNFIENPPALELWGYNAARQQPVLLAMKIVKDNTPLREPAMPLSPLFILTSSRKDYFSQAGLGADDPSFRNVLPPLFQQMANPSP